MFLQLLILPLILVVNGQTLQKPPYEIESPPIYTPYKAEKPPVVPIKNGERSKIADANGSDSFSLIFNPAFVDSCSRV